MRDASKLSVLPLENWRDLRTQLVWAYDGKVADPLKKAAYTGIPIPAWLVRRGSVTLHFRDRKERITSGRWYFPPAEDGFQEFSENAEILSVRFRAEWPTGESLFDRTRAVQVAVESAPTLTRMGERLARLVARRFPGIRTTLPQNLGAPEDYFEIERLLHGWLLAYTVAMRGAGLLPRTIGKLDDRVRQALHELETRNLNQVVRETELARSVGLSRSQLNRLFVRNLGQTPAEYWENKRLQAARLAILESRQSIKSIAYDLGFSSLPHFSAWVKRKLGLPPREMRESDPL